MIVDLAPAPLECGDVVLKLYFLINRESFKSIALRILFVGRRPLNLPIVQKTYPIRTTSISTFQLETASSLELCFLHIPLLSPQNQSFEQQWLLVRPESRSQARLALINLDGIQKQLGLRTKAHTTSYQQTIRSFGPLLGFEE